jgi:hypothetical protein
VSARGDQLGVRGFTATAAIAAVAVTVAVAVWASPALAVKGSTTLKLNGPAAKVLRASDVQIAPRKPAKGGDARVSLPVNAGLAGSATTLLRHRGAIKLVTPNGKQLRLSRLTLLIGKRSRIEARLNGEEIDLFKVSGGQRRVDPSKGTVRLTKLRLKLARGAAKALAAALGLDRLASGRFGTLSANASKLAKGGGKPGGGGPGGSGGGGPAQQSNACPLPSSAGPDAPPAPPPWLKLPGALDITGASMTWRVRESFIRYIATGEGTSASGGASADPPELLPETSTTLSYSFRFPFSNGWIDTGANPADPADDQAAVHFSGALRFLYSAHGIDLSTAGPEIELKGSESRVIVAISENGGLPQRQVLVNLDLARAGAISQSGGTYTYERVPAAVPGGTASSVFAGFYAPGAEFGCFSLSFTTN